MRVAFLTASLAAALAAALAAVAAAQSPEPPIRDCRTRGDPSNGVPVRFARQGDVVVGPVSFGGLARAAEARFREPGTDGRWLVKAPAKVLWGPAVTVTLLEPASGLALAFARDASLTISVTFEPCPPGTPMYGTGRRLRRVTTYPGGFSLGKPGCYPLLVRAGSRLYRRTISLGAGTCRSA